MVAHAGRCRAGIARGGYVLADAPAGQAARAVIIGTGSELQFALQAQALLAAEGLPVRVVSMPCTNVFDRQAIDYQDQVLPRGLPAVAVEAAQPDFWRKYVGREGGVVGIASFGESAPAGDLYRHFDIGAERVAAEVRAAWRWPADTYRRGACRGAPMLRALIWDVDGTVAETERDGHRVAFNQAFEAAGLAWHWDVAALWRTAARDRRARAPAGFMDGREDAPRTRRSARHAGAATAPAQERLLCRARGAGRHRGAARACAG